MWSLQDAKNKFSAVVDAAMRHQPQVVSKRGKPAVVVVSVEYYERLTALDTEGSKTFVDHLLGIPKSGAEDGDVFAPSKVRPRDIAF